MWYTCFVFDCRTKTDSRGLLMPGPNPRPRISRAYLLSFLPLPCSSRSLRATTEPTLTPLFSFAYMPDSATTGGVGGPHPSYCTLLDKRLPRSATKSFRMIFFATPHSLSPLFTYSSERHRGVGVFQRQNFSRPPVSTFEGNCLTIEFRSPASRSNLPSRREA